MKLKQNSRQTNAQNMKRMRQGVDIYLIRRHFICKMNLTPGIKD